MHHASLQHEGAWSFGDSHKCEWFILPSADGPAPNSYSAIPETPCAPAFTIGRAQRKSMQQESITVDAGCYDPNLSAIYPDSKNATIGNQGKKVRGARYSTVVTYNPRLQFVKPQPPAYSLGYRMDTEYDNGRPGPTDYDNTIQTESSFNHLQHHFTRTSKLDPASPLNVPGVGKYNISNKYLSLSPSIRFGTASRAVPGLNTSSPGIYYNVDEKKKESVGITMGQQLPISFNKFIVPGPDKYNIEERKKYLIQKKKSMYTSNRSQCANNSSSFQVSPGTYEIAKDLLDDSKGRGFGKSLRGKLSSLVIPGPGAYDHKPTLKETHGVMAWRNSKQNKFQTPAPGSYNIITQTDRHWSTHSKGMPLSIRPDLSRSMTNKIGPGEYDVSKRLSTQAGVMNRSPRNSLPTTNNPGPGQYNIPTTIGRIPSYNKNLKRKISQLGETKIIKYNPRSTKKSLTVVCKTQGDQVVAT